MQAAMSSSPGHLGYPPSNSTTKLLKNAFRTRISNALKNALSIAAAAGLAVCFQGCNNQETGLPNLESANTFSPGTYYAENSIEGRIFGFGNLANDPDGFSYFTNVGNTISPYSMATGSDQQRVLDAGSFGASPDQTIDRAKILCGATGPIVNIMSTDWNYDGMADFVVVVQDGDKFRAGIMVQTSTGTNDNFFVSGGPVPECASHLSSQPLLADVDGDGRPDLIANVGNEVRYVKNECNTPADDKACMVDEDRSDVHSWPDMPTYLLPVVGDRPPLMNGRGDSAMVDMNGDCRPDIVIVSDDAVTPYIAEYTEDTVTCDGTVEQVADDMNGCVVYKKADQTGQTIALPAANDTAGVYFADMDADGAMDVFAVVCSVVTDSECQGPKVYHWFNKQLRACNTGLSFDASGCRSSDQLCKADDDFNLNYVPANNEVCGGNNCGVDNFVYSHSMAYPTGTNVPTLPTTPSIRFIEALGTLPRTLGLSVNDINLDGFPDVTGVFIGVDGSPEGQIWMNCGKPAAGGTISYDTDAQNWKWGTISLCDMSQTSSSDYSYNRVFQFTPPATNINNPTQSPASFRSESLGTVTRAAFFRWDFMGSGNTDLLLEYNNGGDYNVEAFVRTKTSTNLKLSCTLLNGKCVTPAPCSGGDERLVSTLGVNYPGGVWKIVVTAMDTTLTHQVAMQFMHQGVGHLEMPCAFFGLGQATNYITFTFMGLNNRADTAYGSHPNVIPQIDVMTIPYKRNSPTMWITQMIYTSLPNLPFIIYAGLTFCVALAIVMFIFEMKERKEDKKLQHADFKVHFINR